MWNKLKTWLKAPQFEGEREKQRQAGVLWIVLFAAVTAVPAYIVSFYMTGQPPNSTAWFLSLGLEVVFITMLFAVRTGWIRPVGYVLSTAFWLAGVIAAYQFTGLREMALQLHFLVLILAATTIGSRAVTGYFIISLLAQFFLLLGEYQGWITYTIEPPTTNDDFIVPVLGLLISTLLLRNAIRSLNQAQAETEDNAATLADAYNDLESAQQALEAQSDILQRRAMFLEATTLVTQETAALLEQPDLLFNQIVETIANRFGMAHVGLYLLSGGGQSLQLMAASSEAGKQLVEKAFTLPVSDRLIDRSIPGWVVLHGEPFITASVDYEPHFRVLPGLEEIRSAVTLPLLAQGQVIGAMDFQSSTARTMYKESDSEMLRLLVGQAGMVINNAQLISQLGAAVETQRRLSGDVGRENWLDLIRTATNTSYVSDTKGNSRVSEPMLPEMQAALNSGHAAVSPDNPRMLAVPVRARGEVVAVIDAALPESLASWTPDTISALEAMAAQLGTALEGARLYQQTTERAATEQVTREVTAAMRASLDVDGVLQAALREISEVLRVEQVQVRLGSAGEEANA